MKDFILIPGVWMGAWAWEPMTRGLRALGHHAYPITLSGLNSPNDDISDVGLATHISDVLAIFEETDLHDTILVGHNYSGIVAGMVADQAPDRVAHTIFIEGFLPHDGKSMLDAFSARQRADELQLITENHGRWPVPDPAVIAEGQDLSIDQANWIAGRCAGHPGRTISEPATLTSPLADLHATYVVCTMDHIDGRLADDVEAMRAAPNWNFRPLDTGYWPMVSAPEELAKLLSAIATEVG